MEPHELMMIICLFAVTWYCFSDQGTDDDDLYGST